MPHTGCRWIRRRQSRRRYAAASTTRAGGSVAPTASVSASRTRKPLRSSRYCVGDTWMSSSPCRVSRSRRAMVCSASNGPRCHRCESISSTEFASGHQASGSAIQAPSRESSDRFHSGVGSAERRRSRAISASGADRAPQPTSSSARRSSAVPADSPARTSSPMRSTVVRRVCTASATRARTSRNNGSGRQASTTARCSGTTGRPSRHHSAGGRVVRLTTIPATVARRRTRSEVRMCTAAGASAGNAVSPRARQAVAAPRSATVSGAWSEPP
jgi:hypothetical protein